MSQHSSESSHPSPHIPAGFVGREEAARISGIGITAWNRWEVEGTLTCGQWLTLPGGGRRRIYPTDAIERMIREADLSFPPKGMVDRHEAARIFGVSERTFSSRFSLRQPTQTLLRFGRIAEDCGMSHAASNV